MHGPFFWSITRLFARNGADKGVSTYTAWFRNITVNSYDVNITYDRSSNITLIEDNIHTGFDVDYTNDELNRLTKAEEGTWNGSSITSRSRQQIWDDGAGNLGLSQAGNWERVRLDMNGDNDFIDADEYDDDRTHNDVNELTGRDTDDSGSDDYTLVYDETGNLTDDGENYEYVYDAFYRLCEIRDTSDQSLVARYEYNALDYRITVLQDTDSDGDVDANDLEYHPAYDNRWRIVALYRDTDTDPKEMFIYHAAGLDGRGGSSYIDGMILRDKDANTGWTSASDGTLEQRYYYCQNWRADVVAMVTAGGYEVEWVKYSAYGTPFGLPGADTDSDGDCDATDITQIQTWIDASAYDVRADVDLDGDVDATDKTIAQNNYQGTTSGWEDLTAVGNRKGYAGYEWDQAVGKYHVRNRVLDPVLGRWIQRDPLVTDPQRFAEGTLAHALMDAVNRGGQHGVMGGGDLGEGGGGSKIGSGDIFDEDDCLEPMGGRNNRNQPVTGSLYLYADARLIAGIDPTGLCTKLVGLPRAHGNSWCKYNVTASTCARPATGDVICIKCLCPAGSSCSTTGLVGPGPFTLGCPGGTATITLIGGGMGCGSCTGGQKKWRCI